MVLFPSLPGSSAAQTIHLPAINPNAAVIITICFMLVCLFGSNEISEWPN
jgi:hypothetical protein